MTDRSTTENKVNEIICADNDITVNSFKCSVHPLLQFGTVQGFQSGSVPGTFTRLRSCIVPAEITDPPPPQISGGQNHKYDWLVEYFS